MTLLGHFGFIEQPFGVTPDPRFLHLGPKHREALASLVYGTEENRGFLALIGPPGMGKTSLLFQYLEGLRHIARTAFLFQNPRNASDLMRYLLGDLGIVTSMKELSEMNQMLNEVLKEETRAGRHFILVIDEAQNLSEELLESVRLLSNFETPWMKLMQIVLAGQPQLAERLARPSMAQLRQRISSFIRLEPFTADETNAYIDHRLWVAGYAGSSLFTVGARTLIAEQSSGIPRKISNLCYQSLILAHAARKKQVDSQIVREAVADLAIESLVPRLTEHKSSHSSAVNRASMSPISGKSGRSLQSQPRSSARVSRRISPVIASVSAALFLSIVSGALWKASLQTKPLDETPNVETAALLAPATALAPVPETMSLISARPPVTETRRSGVSSATHMTTRAAVTDQFFSLVVEKGTTLRHISLQHLGRFDPPSLAAILSLNPEITNPDHIEVGQRIRLPLGLLSDSPDAIRTATQPTAPSPAEETR